VDKCFPTTITLFSQQTIHVFFSGKNIAKIRVIVLEDFEEPAKVLGLLFENIKRR
jgi:hypothetical protein